MVGVARFLLLCAALLALPAIATAQPPPPPPFPIPDEPPLSSKPQGTAPNLIVFVHGCCTTAEDVRTLNQRLYNAYVGHAHLDSNKWEIVVLDWSRYTPPLNPVRAYNNATKQGEALFRSIKRAPEPYSHIHLIGHSAGARLIEVAAEKLVSEYETSDKPPFIHLTFLDAFTYNNDDYGGSVSHYPDHYSEHYVDRTSGLFQDALCPLMEQYTDSHLRSAFNFDLTDWSFDLPPDLEPSYHEKTDQCGHQWPLHWYIRSIIGEKPGFQYHRYGHALSREGGNSRFIGEMNQLHPPGDSIAIVYPQLFPLLVTNVTFPPSIPGDGTKVDGTVDFIASEKGVYLAQFDVLGDTCGGCFVPFSFDPGVSALRSGQFTFHMWCHADPPFSWAMELTLKARARVLGEDKEFTSPPYTFSVACEPTASIARSLASSSMVHGETVRKSRGGGD